MTDAGEQEYTVLLWVCLTGSVYPFRRDTYKLGRPICGENHAKTRVSPS